MRGAVAALGLVLAGWPLAAVGQTVIAPDVAAGRTLGTTVGQVGNVYAITGGTRAGGNLFHSFAQFDLGAGDTARWMRPDAPAINNVINRVTGGDPSRINGTIDSTGLPNATFYFVNPAGIVFGPNVQVNVPSAAHFSTAGELRFADGDRFAIATPNGSTLSVAAPEAWGFLGGQGDIALNGVAEGFAPAAATMHFTAGNVGVYDSQVVARGLDFIAVGDRSESVGLQNPLAARGGGRVELYNSLLSAVETRTGGKALRVNGGVVDLQTTSLTSNGDLLIDASVRVQGALRGMAVFSFSRDAAGVIQIRAPEVYLEGMRLSANAIDDGAPGRIRIETGSLIFSRVEVAADALDGVGASKGLIELFSTGELILLSSFIQSNANGAAEGGEVRITGRDVEITESTVESDTVGFATGTAGNVVVTADTLLLGPNGSITSTSNSEGHGGSVGITTRTLSMDTNASIRSDALDSGDAGQVTIKADSIDLLDRASITSRAQRGTGNAGRVVIEVGRLTLSDSNIGSGTSSFGNGGGVDIRASDIVLDGSRRGFTNISSDTLGPGDAGEVNILTKSLVVKDGAFISSDTRTAGNAGSVSVVADEITASNKGEISSNSFGGGAAGGVTIATRKLTVLGGADGAGVISSDSFDSGDAGTVAVIADAVLVDGGFISSDAAGVGDAGDVLIVSKDITLRNFGLISSQTESNGNAGSVLIDTKTLTILDTAGVSSQAKQSSTGDAGDVEITAEAITVRGTLAGISTGSRAPGDAGQITIDTKTLLLDGGVINSAADLGSTGASGSLVISASENLAVVNGGAISTRSTNPNQAGSIEIVTGDLLVNGLGSIISSDNQAGGQGRPGGDAGSIDITADNIRIANGGQISTNSSFEAAGNITINIERPGLFILEGERAPGVIQTSSGPGTGGVIVITNPLAVVSNGGSILALGQQRGANLTLQSRYFIRSADRRNVIDVAGERNVEVGLYDVSAGITSRDLSVLDASKVLRGQCPAARSTGSVSQLITRPVGPYAREPLTAVPDPVAQTPGGSCR